MTIGKNLVILILGVLFCASASPAQGRYEGAYATGVLKFYSGDYAGASSAFEMAEIENPGNHAAYLWHGIALTALDDLNEASNVWLKMPYDENYKASFRYLLGLAYWRRGETSQAKYWLKEGLNHKETRAYQLSQTALKSLMNNEEVDPITDWPSTVMLPRARGVREASSNEPQLERSVGGEMSAPQPKAKQQGTASGAVTARPSGGLWQGTISNGYKGQTIGFRVSADGGTISDVTFHGYFIRKGGGLEETELAPLNDIAVSGGRFSDTQLNGGALVRFDFEGEFTGPGTARGTYRAMSDTDCDTYKLQWTASRVGN